MKLKNLATIKQGYSLRESFVSSDAGINIIQPKDLKLMGELDLHNTSIIDLPSAEKHYLNEGDVLFLARGRYAAAVYRSNGKAHIVSSLLMRLSIINDLVLPNYVTAYLNSRQGQNELKKLSSGSTMPIITKSDLEDFDIPLIPLEVQQKIVKLAEEYKLWQRLHSRQADLQETLINEVIKNTIGAYNG
jgi:hypothetical protein